MYGLPGYSYVYLIYGLYHCLNFITEPNGFPAGILIRGLKLDPPLSSISNNTHHTKPKNNLLDGPGKLCKYLNINLNHNKLDITTHPDFYVEQSNIKIKFTATPRIGISKGQDKLWRYIALESEI